MSDTARAHELARAFEAANEEVVVALEALPEGTWGARCADEGWTVGATAQHIATAYPIHMRLFGAIAEGRPLPPVGWDDIHAFNARRADRLAACGKEETIERLRAGAGAVAGALRALTDDQLERSGAFIDSLPPLTAAQWVELVLIGHPLDHLESIRRAARL